MSEDTIRVRVSQRETEKLDEAEVTIEASVEVEVDIESIVFNTLVAESLDVLTRHIGAVRALRNTAHGREHAGGTKPPEEPPHAL